MRKGIGPDFHGCSSTSLKTLRQPSHDGLAPPFAFQLRILSLFGTEEGEQDLNRQLRGVYLGIQAVADMMKADLKLLKTVRAMSK